MRNLALPVALLQNHTTALDTCLVTNANEKDCVR